MRYMVMDAVGQKVEVEAASPRKAQEQAKRQFKRDPIGHLSVFEQLDPRAANREATQEFFGATPRIIL